MINATTDIMEYTLQQIWKWAGHIARTKDGPNTHSGNQAEGSDQWDDQAEDGNPVTAKKEGPSWNKEAPDRRQRKALMEGVEEQGERGWEGDGGGGGGLGDWEITSRCGLTKPRNREEDLITSFDMRLVNHLLVFNVQHEGLVRYDCLTPNMRS